MHQLFIESTKHDRNENVILKLKQDIRKNIKLYQGDGGSNNANTNDGSTAFTSDDDDLDEDKDSKISHIARDIRKAID